MQLQEFITESLVQVALGVRDAFQRLAGSGAIVNPHPVASGDDQQDPSMKGLLVHTEKFDSKRVPRPVGSIEFDVAVTAGDSKGAKGGVGVVAGVFALGSQGQPELSETTISRLKFAIRMILPRTTPNTEQ